ncbi:MAG: helix-turn-helix transcriptional regulator [Gemmatimonadota bacterium]
MGFGKRLARVREDSGFTQSSLARAVGLSQSAISQIEAGDRNPSYETIRQLAEAMHLTPAYLVGGEVEGLTESEHALFRQYRGLDEKAKRELEQFADYLRAKSATKGRDSK